MVPMRGVGDLGLLLSRPDSLPVETCLDHLEVHTKSGGYSSRNVFPHSLNFTPGIIGLLICVHAIIVCCDKEITGHEKAAGCTLQGSLEEVRDRLVAQMTRSLD